MPNPTKEPMPLDAADGYCDKIVRELKPMCDLIEVAGSVRRRRPMVNDIDIVLLPRPGCREQIRKRCLQTNPQVLADGLSNFRFVLGGRVHVELYFAEHQGTELFDPRPCNFGTLLLMRTGSVAHNIWICDQAKAKGCHWNPQWGLYRGTVNLAAEREADIYAKLSIPYIDPQDRELPPFSDPSNPSNGGPS